MEIFHSPPDPSSFTPLSQHQSQTPSSFYSSTPILYHHSPGAKLIILEYEDLSSSPLAKLADAASLNPPTPATTNGDGPHADEIPAEIVVEGVDVWVTSEKFILYRPSLSTGVSIPYPSISLHAIQSHVPSSTSTAALAAQGLYIQLDTSDGFDDHDPAGTIGLTIIPPLPSQPPSLSLQAEAEVTPLMTRESSESPVQLLFAALSACANLHPDPASDGSEGGMEGVEGMGAYEYGSGEVGGLPPPMPGSGGWITAENMGEFFDEEGNWRGPDLGAGAGVVRERGEGEGQGDGEDEEAKRRRME
ncbi:hypothetical protein MMC30_005190 [Trapelia coarctata]|nr:hypothetical protein [Trapelia coarctata]